MTKETLKQKNYYLALGIGVEKTPLSSICKNIHYNGLSLYYCPAPTNTYNKTIFPKMLKDMDWVKKEVFYFSKQQNQLNQQTPILPFRYGTVYYSQTKMRDFLKKHKKSIQSNLNYIMGKSEWGIKLYVSQSAFRKWLISKEGTTDLTESKTGMEYFTNKRKELKILEDESKYIHDIVKQIEQKIVSKSYEIKSIEAITESVDSQTSLKTISNYAILVDDSDVGKFKVMVNDLSKLYNKYGLSFRVSGPWPAYNFVTIKKHD